MRLVDPHQVEVDNRSESDRHALAYTRHAASAIGNVATRMRLLDTETQRLPVSINDGKERDDNSYVVSPLTAYTGYADYEIRQLDRPWLVWPLRHLIQGISGWLKGARIDRIVQINNWLLSTNLYPPDWDGSDLPEITRLLIETYPDHAICLRSLNRHSNPELINRLEALGYLSIPSRQVYLFDGSNGPNSAYLHRRDSRKDARLLAHTNYTLISGEELADADYPRIEHLYNLLYLEKYCSLNPHFSAVWLHAGQRDGWLKLTALRSSEGRIDAVLGWFSNERTITTPVVGYDTALPQKVGLYRLISQISLEEASRRRCILNMSAGAAHFKRMRGGQPEIEYSLVYVAHLPDARQRVWRMLSRLLRAIGVPIMRKLKL
ncbi:MAG TPA: hypothetical protein VFW68_07870 [Rhodocyclaceae bacterium]|nr:hypothetical protein [Rhodocyclaceae bacterium]